MERMAGNSAPSEQITQSLDTSDSMGSSNAIAGEVSATPVALPRDRILIKTGSLSLIVAQADEALARLDALVKEYDAYIAGRQSSAIIPSREYLAPSEVREMTFTIKVDAARFDAFLQAVKGIGSYTSEQVSVEDVTMQYVDIEARLANQKKVEQRLLSHLEGSTQQLKDIVEVERELSRVREQIETLTAQFKVLRDKVSYSTLTLTISVRPDWVPPVERTFFQQLSDKFVGSLKALWGTAKAFVIVGLAALPWLVVLAGAGWAVIRVLRWVFRRRRKAP